MEVENLEKYKFIVSWRFKEQKLNKEISFSILPYSIPSMLPIFKSPLIWNKSLIPLNTFASKVSHIHWSNFRTLDQPQGSTQYPFLLSFRIEYNAHFKFGVIKKKTIFLKNSTFVYPYLF